MDRYFYIAYILIKRDCCFDLHYGGQMIKTTNGSYWNFYDFCAKVRPTPEEVQLYAQPIILNCIELTEKEYKEFSI